MLRWFVALVFTLFVSLGTACSRGDTSVAQQAARAPSPRTAASVGATPKNDPASPTRNSETVARQNVGFRSRAQLHEHFQKHGAEFGRITQAEYLRQAQRLRDAPVGADIEEIRRDDGTVSRFDRSTGAFLAFNRDGTIRTFFKPNDGEAYFRRQASRVH